MLVTVQALVSTSFNVIIRRKQKEQNIVCEWLTLLLDILEMPGSILDPEVGYSVLLLVYLVSYGNHFLLNRCMTSSLDNVLFNELRKKETFDKHRILGT